MDRGEQSRIGKGEKLEGKDLPVGVTSEFAEDTKSWLFEKK